MYGLKSRVDGKNKQVHFYSRLQFTQETGGFNGTANGVTV